MPSFPIFSSLLRITAKYELPDARYRLLVLVRDAYPETLEGLVPSKLLGKYAFSGPTPHPNEVLNLFVQRELASALPMAYYMAVRRGLGSPHHPAGVGLHPETLQTAVGGLMVLRDMELEGVHKLIMTPFLCVSRERISPKRLDPGASLDMERKVINNFTGSSESGTKITQVFSLNNIIGSELGRPCENCEEWWESRRVEVRRKARAALLGVFGLRV